MSGNSWKNLPQESHWSKQRLRSMGVRLCIILLGMFLCISLCLFFRSAIPKQNFERLHFSTNGVLDEAWFVSHMNLTWGKELMSIDLEELQKKILQFSQIEAANIFREFPSSLRIVLHERKPCAKMMLLSKGKKVMVFVSSKGIIFQPIHYLRKDAIRYPTLSDVAPRLIEHRTILGFEAIAQLLDFLQNNAPDLYQRITKVSLKHFDPFLEKKWWTVDFTIHNDWVLTFPVEDIRVALVKLRSIFRSLSSQQRQALRHLDVSLTHPTLEY